MIGEETTPILSYNLDTNLLQNEFSKIGLEIDNRKYKKAVEQASVALNAAYESVLLAILDHRSYALMMLCKFDEAVKDAYDMITYKPTFPDGYLRLGELYQIQGKQRNAIEAYDMGLQSVEVDHPRYPQIVEGKELATKKSKTSVDFVSKLPVEIVDDIMSLVAFNRLSRCLAVSFNWRTKLFQCPKTWKSLRTGSGTSTDWTTAIMPRVSANVENLIVDTTSLPVFQHYLRTMKSGSFEKLKTLRLDTSSSITTNATIAKLISGAFWKVNRTLTSLVVDFKQGSIVIIPSDLLSFCPCLKNFEYSIPHRLSDVLDDSARLDPHKSLLDMRLVAKSITGKDLERLLYCCQRLLRLRLTGADNTVFNPIDTLCPSLKIFGCNTDKYSHVQRLESLNGEQHADGLQQLNTHSGGVGVAASAILPLIHRNMHSLKALFVHIGRREDRPEMAQKYRDLELKNLRRLSFYGNNTKLIQPLILNSISTCTELTSFCITSSKDMPLVIRELISLPRLETLRISYPKDGAAGKKKLIQLLNRYANISKPGRHLKCVALRYCKTLITDAVLDSLAGVQSLEDIFFEGWSDITSHGMEKFYKKIGNNLTAIRLTELDVVNDSTLITISSNSDNLKRIELGKLKNLSDQGIKELVDRAPKLQTLNISNCVSITLTIINYAKTKLRYVTFTK